MSAKRPFRDSTNPQHRADGASPEADGHNGAGLSGRVPDELADRAAAEAGHDRADRPIADPVVDKQAPPTIWEQLGGPMGMVDSGLPVLVFIVANTIGGLGWGIGAALAAALVIAGLRIARRRPVTQAVAGVFGVAIAAYIAYRTDSAKGYFLLGIWSYLLYGGALLLSILTRWPLVGAIWEAINGRGTGWRSDRRLVRRYDWATLVWVVVFGSRYLVQNYLYDTDQVGWLAAVRLLMGYPVFLVAIVISVWIVAGTSAIRLPGRFTRKA